MIHIAPFPGLLLTESDAFGHTLSWIYNGNGQISQMTDPAGGIYSYQYDGNGNIASVTFPDNSTKGYSYNETADTGGSGLTANGVPFTSTLTGITDESDVRFATFMYNSSALATNAQHAGGVDDRATACP